jgi:predicted PurR-regulated permease PerM
VIRLLLLVVLLALFLAYLVAPIAQRVQRLTVLRRRVSMPRWVAIIVVYAAGAVIASLVWGAVGPRWEWQADRLQEALPRYADQALDRVLFMERRLNAVPVPAETGSVAARVTLRLSSVMKEHVRETLSEIGDSLPHVRWLWLVPVLSLLFLQVSPTFRRTTVRALPPGHLQWRGDEFLSHVNWVLAGYTRAQVIAALWIATATGTLFAVLKVPYALSLGLAAGALELLPIVGPLTIALSVALLTSGPPLVIALAGLGVLRFLQDYVVYPRLMGRRMRLPPLAVVVALLLGARLGGIVGVALALPLVGIGSVAWRHYRDHRDIERLVRSHAISKQGARDARAVAHTIAQASEVPADAAGLPSVGKEPDGQAEPQWP